MEASNFAFLRELHPELASLAEQAEGSIWMNPRGTLVQGRLFGEILATTISTQEKVEPVFSIKQIDRLHKLAREGLLSEEVRNKFEWLRMNGNSAAHSGGEVHLDQALTAHRNMFELSAWYMELYGSVDIQIPSYHMPVNKQPTNQQIEQPPVLDTGLVEKVISDQFEARLLPTLDEKFRSIEQALQRIVETQAAPRDVITSASSVAQPVVEIQPAHEGSSPTESPGRIEIAEELKCRDLSVLDKRPFGGALWVVGGWELKETLLIWNDQGIHFRFAKNGSQSTKRKPAWFMLGKNPSAERWITASLSNGELAASPRESMKGTLLEVEADGAGEVQKSREIQRGQEVQQTDAVSVPEKLQAQPLRGYASEKLTEISAALGVVTFGDWNEERLLTLYEQQPKLLHDVMVQLWFFGFQFDGKLGRFIKLQRADSDGYIGDIEVNKSVAELLTPDVCRLLGRFGIVDTRQLSGIPLSSLAWLLRGRHAETVERLRELETRPAERDLAGISEAEAGYKIVRLNREQLLIPEQLWSTRIEDLNFQGCNALLRGIVKDWNIHVLGELPEVLSILPTRIKAVGLVALAKFFEQLKGLLGTAGTVTLSGETEREELKQSATVSEVGEFLWHTEITSVSKEESALPLDETFFMGIEKLMSAFQESGIRTVGELPCGLEQLRLYKGVRVPAIQKFHDQLVQMLMHYRAAQEDAIKWNAMSLEERIDNAIGRIEQSWHSWMQGQDKSRGSERNLELLHFRWNIAKAGRRATLEETGNHFGLTRERVRQILSKQIERLAPDTQQLEHTIRAACQPLNGFYYYPLHAKDSFVHYLLIDILGAKGLTYLEEYGWWSERDPSEIEFTEQALHKTLKQMYKGTLIGKQMLLETLDTLAEEYKYPAALLLVLSQSVLIPSNNEFILANSSKADLVEMVLKKYPDGVEVYKKADELIKEANALWFDSFTKERDFTSILSRDEYADTAYLWGRGIYIHHSFVKPDLILIEKVSLACEQLLEVQSPISVGRMYNQFAELLQAAEVPNEYALYTLLRKYGFSSLQLRKFPHIWHENDGFQLNNSEMIKSYIREMNRPVRKEDLLREFVKNRGWKPFTVEYNLSTDPDYIRVDYGVVGLREFYYLDEANIKQLFKKLNTLLEDRSILHVNLLFEENKEYCQSLDIHSPFLLYDLLQEYADSDIRFIRFPYVVPAGGDIEKVSTQVLIEQYIADQSLEIPVPREQVLQWLTEELGGREESLDLILAVSKDIIYYLRGQYGEYIHRQNLGWNEDKEEELLALVDTKLQVASQDGKPYLLAKEMVNEELLPKLKVDLDWSEDLLIDLLKKSGKVQLIGSYDAIIVSLSDPKIRRESDFVAYVIKQYFGGRVQERALTRKLAELRYSKDGKLLFETLEDIENGTARIQKEEDWMYSI